MKSLIRVSSVALGLATVVAAQASNFYGINGTAQGGGVYKIDVNTGVAQLEFPTLKHLGETNGLAWDGGNWFYYVVGTNTLVAYDAFNVTTTVLGPLKGRVSSATFYNGAYYYYQDRSKSIWKQNVTGATLGALSKKVVVTGTTYQFGDIAARQDGVFFGTPQGGKLIKGDLNTGPIVESTVGVIAGDAGKGLQTAFFGTTLYGVRSDVLNGDIYAINTSDASSVWVSTVSSPFGNLRIRDAAGAAPVPEPATMAGLAMGALALMRRRKKA
jgi:hypothetical protein